MPAAPADRDRLGITPFVFDLPDCFDQNFKRLPNQCPVLFQRDPLLEFHDRRPALLGNRLWNGVRQERALGLFLERVSKDADVTERHLFDEVVQSLELFLGLAWVADDQGRAHRHVRQPLAGMIDQPAGHLDIAGTAHISQHRGIGVLNRHVQIGHEHPVLSHHINHPEREQAGVDIEHPEPGEIGNLVGNHLEQ